MLKKSITRTTAEIVDTEINDTLNQFFEVETNHP